MIGLRKIYTSDKMSIYYIGTRKGGALGDTGAYPAGVNGKQNYPLLGKQKRTFVGKKRWEDFKK